MSIEPRQQSYNIKNLAARIAAAQSVFQALHNDQKFSDVFNEFVAHRGVVEIEGDNAIQPDGALMKRIILGVEERREVLEEMIKANLTNKTKGVELLLKAILLCAAYELISPDGVDTPIIINDYLNVVHSFYESGEVSLSNGVLDAISKSLK